MFELIACSLGVPVAVVSVATGKFLWANPAYCQLLGRTLEELHELTWIDVTDKSTAETLAHQGTVVVTKKRYLTKTGAVDVQVRITTITSTKVLLEVDLTPPAKTWSGWSTAAIVAVTFMVCYLAYLVAMHGRDQVPSPPSLPSIPGIGK